MKKKQINRICYIIGITLIVVGIPLVFSSRNWQHRKNVPADADGPRVICLSPNITEMIFALGMGDCIVGASDHCNYPIEAKDIERVGGLELPNMEKLLSLCPDVVMSTNTPSDAISKLLSQSGIELITLKIPDIEGMFDGFLQVGYAVHKPERAKELIAVMRAELNIIREQYGNTAPDERTTVFVEIWHNPITTAGNTSFIDDVIMQAGGVNVAHNISQTYPRINPGKVIEWNPDVIITSYMGSKGHTAEQMAKRIGWSDISAVKSGRIINDLPSDLILRPGPRLIEGVKALAEILHDPAAGKAE